MRSELTLYVSKNTGVADPEESFEHSVRVEFTRMDGEFI
jgi:hypothetical protein